MNGKKYAWQGVALLPFVDENRLKQALLPLHDSLTSDESESFYYAYWIVRKVTIIHSARILFHLVPGFTGFTCSCQFIYWMNMTMMSIGIQLILLLFTIAYY